MLKQTAKRTQLSNSQFEHAMCHNAANIGVLIAHSMFSLNRPYCGNTPLHTAIELGRNDMVKALLSHGVDPDRPQDSPTGSKYRARILDGSVTSQCSRAWSARHGTNIDQGRRNAVGKNFQPLVEHCSECVKMDLGKMLIGRISKLLNDAERKESEAV
jgi:hypothetical protein